MKANIVRSWRGLPVGRSVYRNKIHLTSLTLTALIITHRKTGTLSVINTQISICSSTVHIDAQVYRSKTTVIDWIKSSPIPNDLDHQRLSSIQAYSWIIHDVLAHQRSIDEFIGDRYTIPRSYPILLVIKAKCFGSSNVRQYGALSLIDTQYSDWSVTCFIVDQYCIFDAISSWSVRNAWAH